MKNVLTMIAIAATLSLGAQSNWAIDNAHTSVKFSVTHLSISQVEGQFKKFSGTITSSKEDFSDAKIDFTVDVNSISTENDFRDKHLKSDDFFNAEKFPNMTFTALSMKKVSGNKYTLEGNLTIRDVTKKITLDAVYNGTVKDPQGNTKAGFKVTGVIDRFDYNLKWNKLAEAGAVVGKDVAIDINIELKKM